MVETLTCEECGRAAIGLAQGWRGYLIDVDEGGREEAVFFCPVCVAREFHSNSDGSACA